MPPGSSSRLYCSGKGGNVGHLTNPNPNPHQVGRKYMIDRAIQFLTDQGHSGKRDQIMIVGDRFDTVSLPLTLALALTTDPDPDPNPNPNPNLDDWPYP
eukprot:scaffold23972_cov60-Phaeocystis_antarctica.AAC.1